MKFSVVCAAGGIMKAVQMSLFVVKALGIAYPSNSVIENKVFMCKIIDKFCHDL